MIIWAVLTFLIWTCFFLCEAERPNILEPHKGGNLFRYVKKGGSFKLQCNATSSPPPRYNWSKDDVPIAADGITYMNETTGELVISKVDVRVEGRYRCKANNSDGVVLSPEVTVQIAILEKYDHQSEVTLRVKAYQPLSLECRNPPKSIPDGRIGWYTHKENDGMVTDDIPRSSRVVVDTQGSLHFLYLLRSDAGLYRCGVWNNVLGEERLGSPVSVKVDRSDGGDVKHRPALLSSFVTTPAMFGGEVKLECVFAGYPIPTVEWSKNGVVVQKGTGRYQVNTSSLIIYRADETDTGSFICHGRNPAGETKKILTVLIVYTTSIAENTEDQETRVPPQYLGAADNEDTTSTAENAEEDQATKAPETKPLGAADSKEDHNPSEDFDLTTTVSVIAATAVVVVVVFVITMIILRRRRRKCAKKRDPEPTQLRTDNWYFSD